MLNKNFFKTYFTRALIAAVIYCITVVIFLSKENYTATWVLFLGNVLYMLTLAIIIFLTNRAEKFEGSPVTSTISGHILSFTGAAISVILSLILYVLFYLGLNGTKGETLHQAPAGLSADSGHGILFVLIIVTALGNTITGFFAALFTSFDTSNEQPS